MTRQEAESYSWTIYRYACPTVRYRQILAALEDAGVRYVVVGSMATALHGAAGEPRDLDLVIDRAYGGAVTHILMQHGFCPSIPLALHELTVLRFVTSEGLELDVFARFAVPFEELFARSELRNYDGLAVRTASAADLILARERTGR